ncbi:MAG: hypothetical protein ACOC33_01340 [bacterium]
MARGAIKKKEFSLVDYKKNKGYDQTVKFKPRTWIPITNVLGNSAFSDATGLKGIPKGECIQIMGHTDTSKSTLLLETAYSCQKNNVLPVFVITELKFAWEHLKMMGIEFDEIIDEDTGEVSYEGNFLFIDRSKFNTIEEMGKEINKILDDQEKGDLPVDLCFLIDSIGGLQSDMSYNKSSSNNEWDAGAISRVFGKSLMPRINLSKKDTHKFTNTLVVITQVWVRKPDSPVAKPRLASKGGDTIPFNSTLQIRFGNVTNSGTNKLKVKKNGKDVIYANRTRVTIEKNHVNGISTAAKLITTPHGFIEDNDKKAKEYFTKYSDMFLDILGGGDVNDVVFFEEGSDEEDTKLIDYEIKQDGSVEIRDEE